MPSHGRRTAPMPKGWEKTRRRILHRDGHTCRANREDTDERCAEPANQVDHIIPAHLGGPDTDDNLQALCQWHHDQKTAREASAIAHALPPRERPREPHPGLLN